MQCPGLGAVRFLSCLRTLFGFCAACGGCQIFGCLRGLSTFWLLTGLSRVFAGKPVFLNFPFENVCICLKCNAQFGGLSDFLSCLRGLFDFWAAYGGCPIFGCRRVPSDLRLLTGAARSLCWHFFLNFPFGIVCIIASHRIAASKFVVSRCHCGVRVCDSS